MNSYLQWAGSKQNLLKELVPILTKHKKKILAEPFIGAANVSLNFSTDRYIWNDLNSDLYYTHKKILENPDEYIRECKSYFDRGLEDYLAIRDEFNSMEPKDRTALFQYLNKHGFNGLCRYNSKGKFNVPKGSSAGTYNEHLIQDVSSMFGGIVDIYNLGFEDIFEIIEKEEDVLVYCDPPYVPAVPSGSEVKYTTDGFTEQDQIKLKQLCLDSKHICVISNHWTDFTKELYKDADEIYTYDVRRTISCKGSERLPVKECIVVYLGK